MIQHLRIYKYFTVLRQNFLFWVKKRVLSNFVWNHNAKIANKYLENMTWFRYFGIAVEN
jgi:hypothetical protein